MRRRRFRSSLPGNRPRGPAVPRCLFVVLCLGLAVAGYASEPADLLDSAAIFGQETTAEIRARLTIDEQGRRKERSILILVEQQVPGASDASGASGSSGGERKIFAQIVDPPFLDRMRFLSVTDARGNQARWTASSTGVRRIADSGANEELFGSDFTVQDFTGIDIQSYELREAARRRLDGREMRVLVATGGGRRAAYPGRVYWIDAETELVRQIEYYSGVDALAGGVDTRGEPSKRYRVESTLTRGGNVYPKIATMSKLSEESTSTLFVEEFTLVDDIPDRNFNRAALR